MNKSLAMLALSSMIAACAAQPAATAEAASPAAKPAAKPQAETRVCEEFEEESTGTRLGTERVCKTVPAREVAPQTS